MTALTLEQKIKILLEKNYVVFHLHSDRSNSILMDSTSKPEDYIIRAKELGMKAIAFSEHGSVLNWIEKKNLCDKHKIKYIHGSEFYVTTTLTEKVREAYHMGLYAKNWEGVKEINRLSSASYSKDDNHNYYRPRISIQELMATSDNIIITTACLASFLVYKDTEWHDVFLNWMSENKHRCFLEIQYHNFDEQKGHNLYLYEKHLSHGIPLIAGTDTHALNKEKLELRTILQHAKGIKYTYEDECDLTFKSCQELIEMFEKQNCLPMDVVLEAIDNTNKLADMVEDFELDKSHKYPKIYANAEQEYRGRINQGIVNRGIDKYEPRKKKIYYDRLMEEFNVIKKLNAIDYFLLLDDMIQFCKANNIGTSPRGSCNGSQILWTLENTDIDSYKYNLPFFRFMNDERVSLADVDIDMSGKRRDEVKDFLYNYPNIQGGAIVTYNTYGWKGAIRAVGKGLDVPLNVVDEIVGDIEEIEEENELTGEVKRVTTFKNKEKWQQQHPDLLKYAALAIGVVDSIGVHACGFVVTDRNIDEEIGTLRTDNSKWVISQNNMKAIDSANFVKMDLLVVDNVQMVEDVCELAEIDKLKNDLLDFEDENVWNEMLRSGLGIFQFEKTGWFYLKEMLQNYPTFREVAPNASRLDLMTALNGIIRPAGDSIRDYFVKGIPKDNGMYELNEYLGKTLSYLIYQESIMMFLHHFCGYTMAQSDNVRRGIAKKYGTEQLIPEIKQSFMTHCIKHYPQYNKEHLSNVADEILQVIKDASDYGFSENHSCPYSILGFKGAYLRHYYPLEFLTTQLRINDGKIDKTTKIMEFIRAFTDIKVLPIKFRKSRGDYFMSRDDNAIYKGIKSIKEMSANIAEELYELRNNQYETFVDLLIDIENNVVSKNKTQMEILIRLNYFEEFGKPEKLLAVYDEFKNGKLKYDKKHTDKTKEKRIPSLKEFEKNSLGDKLSPRDIIIFEKDILGYVESSFPEASVGLGVVTGVDTKYAPKYTVFMMKAGREIVYKVSEMDLNRHEDGMRVGDMIEILGGQHRPRKKLIDNKWVPQKDTDPWITQWRVVERKLENEK